MSMYKEKKYKSTYVKCYLNLCCLFDPQEIIFILHMINLNCLRNGGYNTAWSKNYLMERMNIGLRVFNRCVKRMTALGLLERIPQCGMYDYRWNMEVYTRLLEILSATSDTKILKQFCRQIFVEQERTILSITDNEIKKIEGKKHISVPFLHK